MLYGMMSYFAKLTGNDVSSYLNKITSVGLRKAYCYRQMDALTASTVNYLHFFAIHPGGKNSWHR